MASKFAEAAANFLADVDAAVVDAAVAVVVVVEQQPQRELRHELRRGETEACLRVEDFEAFSKTFVIR